MDIDLNSDLGEGCGSDAEIMPLLTSANISCGFHAGGVRTAKETLALAVKHGVAVGAHPGYPDPEHFGRVELDPDAVDIFSMCVYQVGALRALAASLNVTLSYLKPHGALYNQACRDERVARPVAAAARFLQLPVLALPGTPLEQLCKDTCRFVPEGFGDRRYDAAGTLTPRDQPNAFVEDPQEAVRQAERLIRDKGVRSLCVHGDNPQALAFVQALRQLLVARGWNLRAFA